MVAVVLLCAGLPGALPAATSHSFSVVATSSVYAGSTVYIQMTPVLPSGAAAVKIYYNSVKVSGAVLPFAFNCRVNDCLKDSLGRYYDTSSAGAVVLRIDVPTAHAAGQYTVAVVSDGGGYVRTTNIPLLVKAPPAAIPPVSSLPAIAIAGKAKWESTLLTLAPKWCNPAQVFSFGSESEVWFYDGARVYFEAFDYTGNRNFEACAYNIARQYRDYVVNNSGKLYGWRIFTHGLEMAYRRSGDASYLEAIRLLSTNPASITWTLLVSEERIREAAYSLNAMVDAERLGEPRSPHRARLVDYLLGHFDRLFISKNYALHQMFFDALGAEALINYYELTRDPRIPPMIKIMLDWTWDYAWSKSAYKLMINPEPVGPKCSWGCRQYNSDLVNLTAPVYAWYWRISGDPVYQQRGDEMFAHALDTDISYSAKIFSQNYHWSFDYVRWRTVEGGVTPPPPPPACAYSVTPGTAAAGSAGGAVPAQVATTSTCSWDAYSNISWVSVSGAAKTGSGSVSIMVAANPETASRTAAVRVADKQVTITQAAAPAPAAGRRSLDFPITQYGSAATGLSTTAPGSTSLRIEARFHNWTPQTGNAYHAASIQALTIRWKSGQAAVWCQAPADGGTAGNAVTVPVSGRPDFIIRCQRDVPNNRLTGEIWNADGSNYQSYSIPITRWATTVNLSTIHAGRSSLETPTVAFRLGFMRVFNTVKPLGGPLPMDGGGEVGNIANYEFNNSSSDTSGNNRHLVLSQPGVYFDTPVN